MPAYAAGICLHVLLLIALLVSCPLRSMAEVRRSLTKDGTVHYSNREIGKGNHSTRKRVKFNSSYIPLINRIAGEEGVDPWLIQCMVKVESDFRADAVSVSGAMGLMQLMQEVARYYHVENPFNPEENVRAGIRHFKSLLRYFRGDITLALAAYHAGLGTVRKHNAVPPIKETVAYVHRVIGFYDPSGALGSGSSIDVSVKKLYRRVHKDGTLEIYSR